MTARIDSFLVVLADDIREDDAQQLAQLFLHIKGVAAVTPNVTSIMQSVAEQRVRHQLCEKMLDVLKP